MSRRRKSITVRLSDEEQARLKTLSAEKDVPMSIVLRQLARKEVGLPTHVSAEDTPPKRNA